MKAIHITSKVLLKLVEIGVIVVLIASLIPIVSGGIAVDIVKDPAAELDDTGSKVTISGEFSVTSSLLWDISDFTYSVSVGDRDDPVAKSDEVRITIAKDSTTDLKFNIEVPLVNLALYVVDSSLGESGGSTIKIPIGFHIGGAYVQDLVKFDMDVDLSVMMDLGIDPKITYDEATNTLDVEIIYSPGTDLGIPEVSGSISLDGVYDGAFGIEKVGDDYKIYFDLGTGVPDVTLLEALEDTESVSVDVPGYGEYTLTGEELDMMKSLLADIIAGAV